MKQCIKVFRGFGVLKNRPIIILIKMIMMVMIEVIVMIIITVNNNKDDNHKRYNFATFSCVVEQRTGGWARIRVDYHCI